MAQQSVVDETSCTINLKPDEKMIEILSLSSLSCITIKKIGNDAFLIVHDDTQNFMIDVKLLKLIYPHLDSIMLLVSVAERY